MAPPGWDIQIKELRVAQVVYIAWFKLKVSCKIKSVRAFVAAQKQIPMYAWFGHHIWRMGWSWSRSQNTTMSHGRSKYRFLLMETTKQ